jgi:hypothetical protein
MRPGKKHNSAIRFALVVALGVLSAVVAGGIWGWPDHIVSSLDVIWTMPGGGN